MWFVLAAALSGEVDDVVTAAALVEFGEDDRILPVLHFAAAFRVPIVRRRPAAGVRVVFPLGRFHSRIPNP